jgi:hypothetical protein
VCRYAMYGPYKEHWACFDCRKMFRRPAESELARPKDTRPVRCPECRNPLRNMGRDFKAPPKSDREHWQAVARLYHAGFTCHGCGCGGSGFRPSQLRDIPAFLAEQARIPQKQERSQRLALRDETWRKSRNLKRKKQRVSNSLNEAIAT